MTLEAFREAFNRWLNDDYALRESPAEAAKPLSALRAFEELRAPDFVLVRPADEDLALLLMPSKAVCVTANGILVSAFNRHYWADELDDRAGGSSRDRKRKVIYRFDPDDPAQIWVFDAESGRFLARATPYLGEGLHPLAPAGSPESERVSALMAFRRGRENRIRSVVREKREASDNRMLAMTRTAGQVLGLHDDLAGMPTPQSRITQLTEVSGAAPAVRKSKAIPRPAAPSAADLLAQHENRDEEEVGAFPSALDVLAGLDRPQKEEVSHGDGAIGEAG